MKKVVLFMRQYSAEGCKFQKALQKEGLECQIVALEDDGFLPEGIISPYEYFILKQNREVHVEKMMHYNFLNIPEFWEICPNGVVCNMGKKKATVVCKQPEAKGTVQRVEWQMDDGWVYRIDYYNRSGLRFASEFLGRDGKTESKVYYSDNRQEVIVEQPQNDIVTLMDKGKMRAFFSSYYDFLNFFLEDAGCKGKYILFVDEGKALSLLNCTADGNTFWKHLVFQNIELMDRYVSSGGKGGNVYYEIPEAYPINQVGNDVLILTASDKLAGIEDLIRELPDINFHIAANTQVSDKLSNLQSWENVKVYPQIGKTDLERLWRKCDFYLDINFYWEIHDAINQASLRNLLILGFEDTLHRRELVAEDCIFSGQDYEGMIRMLREVLNYSERIFALLEKQQARRSSVWDELKAVLEAEEN